MTVWPLSAATPAALTARARQLANYTRTRPDIDPHEIGRALSTRTLFDHRAVIVTRERETLLAELDALARGEPAPSTISGSARTKGKVAFLFSGQGSQRTGMGRELYETFPVFAETFDAACAELDQHLDHPLASIVFADPNTEQAQLLHQTQYTQPALFALHTALYKLTETFGVHPDYLIGHSIGELSAAHLSGVLTLPDAAALVTTRARLMQTLPQHGAMTTIQATEQELAPHLQDHPEVGLAAVNTPDSCVISGHQHTIEQVAAHFRTLGRRTRRLHVSHAFHSPHTDTILDQFHHTAAGLTYHPPAIPIISNLTGHTADPTDLQDPHYWTQHIRATVQYATGTTTLHHNGVTQYLELGPDTTLTTLTHTTLDTLGTNTGPAPVLTPTLRPDHPETTTYLTALAHLHTHSTTIDWTPTHTTNHPPPPPPPPPPLPHNPHPPP